MSDAALFGNLLHLGGSEHALVELEIMEGSIPAERAVRMTASETERGGGNGRVDIPCMGVIDGHGLAIEVDGEALLCFGFSIVGDHDMKPLVEGELLLGHGLDSLGGPGIDDVASDPGAFEPEIPTPKIVPGVHAGNDGATRLCAKPKVTSEGDLILGVE